MRGPELLQKTTTQPPEESGIRIAAAKIFHKAIHE